MTGEIFELTFEPKQNMNMLKLVFLRKLTVSCCCCCCFFVFFYWHAFLKMLVFGGAPTVHLVSREMLLNIYSDPDNKELEFIDYVK
jgi:hypothetical protein